MLVEPVAGSPWNGWPDVHGIGGRITVVRATGPGGSMERLLLCRVWGVSAFFGVSRNSGRRAMRLAFVIAILGFSACTSVQPRPSWLRRLAGKHHRRAGQAGGGRSRAVT